MGCGDGKEEVYKDKWGRIGERQIGWLRKR